MPTYRGRVVSELFGKGSKSERQAVILKTDARQNYLLRRPGGNPFRDVELEALVGKRLVVEGRLHLNVLIMDKFREDGTEETGRWDGKKEASS